ncbi:hypothetical protein BDZ97DRAFT_1796641 [Flammula alnicola]|nr:hypothetical protein BDZ97DRAFT_1796641 [Flammula alnicola]
MANQICVGQIDIGIVLVILIPDEVLVTQAAKDCLLPMGITSENVVKEYSFSPQVQDDFTSSSFQKAAAAIKTQQRSRRGRK